MTLLLTSKARLDAPISVGAGTVERGKRFSQNVFNYRDLQVLSWNEVKRNIK